MFQFKFLEIVAEKKLRLLFITGIGALLILFVFRFLLIFSGNGELYGIDNTFVYSITRTLAGYDLYYNPEQFPYTITLYSPLYYNICTLIGRLFHINVENPIQVYQLCRSVSLVCDIVTCGLLYLILRKRFQIQNEITVLAIAVLATVLCYLGYTFSRCDSLLLTMYALFIYQLTGPLIQQNRSRIFFLALLSVACIFSKQNGIVVPLLALVWLFIHKAGKMAIYYSIFFIIIFFPVLLTYVYVLNYHYLFDNTITALQNGIVLSWFYVDIFKRLMNSLWILLLYIPLMLSLIYWYKPSSLFVKSLSAIFIIQFVFSLGTSLKDGSSAGYFNENYFLGTIIFCYVIHTYQTKPVNFYINKIILFFLPLFILFLLHTVAQGYLFFIQKRNEKMILYQQQKNIRDYLRPQLKNNYVFNLGNQNTDFFKTLFYKEMAVPSFDIVDWCTIPRKTFDYTVLKNDFSNGKIAYIISPEGTTYSSIWGVSLQNYHKDTTINGFNIYRFQQP